MQELETFGRRFAVGLSFASEDGGFIDQLVTALKGRFGSDRVFDYPSRQPELVGPDGLPKLLKIYREDCCLVVPIFSNHYATKQWCRSEWDDIRKALQGSHADRLIPLTMEKVEIPGWGDGDISYAADGHTPEQLANFLFEAYQLRVEKFRLIFSAPGSAAGPQSNPINQIRSASDDQSIARLRQKLVTTLGQESLRKLLVQANDRLSECSAEELADEILAVMPAKRGPRERWSPLCFLYFAVEYLEEAGSAGVNRPEQAVLDGMERLLMLLLPVSVQDVRSEDLRRAVDSVPDLLRVAGHERMVGASIAGKLLGLQVWLNSDGQAKVRNAVHPNREKPQIPLSGIAGKGLVDAVREELAEVLGPRSSSVQDVQAALTGWAGREAYLCVWLMDAGAGLQISELRRLFPELILLVCDGTGEGEVNPQILWRLQEIESFIRQHRRAQV